jgi:hypothetical protein
MKSHAARTQWASKMCRVLMLVTALILWTNSIRAADAPDNGPIDWDRARALYQREQRGEQISPDERAYLERAKAERRKNNASTQPAAGGRNSPMSGKPKITGQESTGLVPLTQLKGDQKYKGFDGGLYGGGSNQPPEAQLKAALNSAGAVTALDASGKPAAGGKVVLMSIGMSNTTMEFSRFKQIADIDQDKSPTLLIVDAAQGGKDAAAWANVGNGITNGIWEEADRRLKAAGATADQVQVVWIKQAMMGPARLGEFPDHARVLQNDVETILTVAKIRYPNLRLAYLSSRIYAGYAVTMLNPEPYAYEGAFAMRWVIEDQMKGEAKLNFDPAKGEVKAPVVLWGPYLWADGVKGREGDDLVYRHEDLGNDGTHPSPSGREKVAEQLLKFLKTDPTAKPWFIRQ